jgi:hypothetical protein
MSANNQKENLVKNIKAWMQNDRQIKVLQSQIKECKLKKKELSENLVEIMKTNEIDCFDVNDGKILYKQSIVKSGLNKKHLMDSLEKYFENNPDVQTEEIAKFILDSRSVKTTESIRLKPVKK